MNLTYIIGHKNPDTDSIASAMAYAYLKQKLGYNVVAGRLGTLNEETKYATRVFNVEAPQLLKDARLQLKDIEMDHPVFIDPEASCNDAYQKIIHTNNKTLYVTIDNKLKGIVSIGDLASLRLLERIDEENMLSKTTLELLSKDVKGEIVYEAPFNTNGKLTNLHSYDLKDSITMAYSDQIRPEHLFQKPAVIIISGEEVDNNIISYAKKMKVSIILTKMDIIDVNKMIYASVPVKEIMTSELTSYHIDEYIDDVLPNITNTRFRSYPVINDKDEIVGSISRYHLFHAKKKQYILVDHSSMAQSIDHIKDAEVIEVVDHHHIGDIETSVPIYYRNQRVGCTCTIIYDLYKENKIKPNKQIAGMMLSAIISDTLGFKSKTTTQYDKQAAQALAKIAKVDLDKYINELLSASVSLKTANVKDLIYADLKTYKFGQYKVAVSQTNYSDIEEIQVRLNEFKRVIKEEQESKGYDLMIMMFTHVLASGTMFVYYGSKAKVMESVIQTQFDESSGFDRNIMSRKQQLIPILSELIHN